MVRKANARTALGLTVALLLAAPLAAGPAAAAGSGGGTLTVRASKATYRAGEPVRLALTYRNAGNAAVRIFTAPPSIAATLTVTRDGKPLAAPKACAPKELGPAPNPIPTAVVRAGASYALRVNSAAWLPLADWCYDAGAPGRYRVTATMLGFVVNVRQFQPAVSKRVEFTVLR